MPVALYHTLPPHTLTLPPSVLLYPLYPPGFVAELQEVPFTTLPHYPLTYPLSVSHHLPYPLYPTGIVAELQEVPGSIELVIGLLSPSPTARTIIPVSIARSSQPTLGSFSGGGANAASSQLLLKNPFFKGFDWAGLKNQAHRPIFIPPKRDFRAFRVGQDTCDEEVDFLPSTTKHTYTYIHAHTHHTYTYTNQRILLTPQHITTYLNISEYFQNIF